MFITHETILSEYFTYDGIAGLLISDDRRLFDRLCDIFLLPESEREKLYALTRRDAVKAVRTKNDYMRFLRTQKYAETVGLDDDVTDEERTAIAIKGAALTAAADSGLCADGEATNNAVYDRIDECALGGSLIALRLSGFLRIEGLFAFKDEAGGLSAVTKAARWNSVEGALMSLYYDKARRRETLDALATFARGTVFEPFVGRAEKKYRIKAAATSAENKLLKKAFGAGTLNPDVYSAQYARIIFGKAIPLKDKEKLLFAASKELLCETVDLPLKLSFKPIKFDRKTFVGLSPDRETETSAVIRAAENFDSRRLDSYRPLCICGDSSYLLNEYIRAVKAALAACRVERIDVADLCDYDFEPTGNNVFVRSCDEDENNVCLLVFEGDINERTAELARAFLQSGKRGRTRLLRPATVLDLSAMLPICFCDAKNAKALKKYCDVVTLAPVNGREKLEAADRLLAEKRSMYGVGKISLDKSGADSLARLSMDEIESVLDRAVRMDGRKGKPLSLTAEQLARHIEEAREGKIRYGFGGEIQ